MAAGRSLKSLVSRRRRDDDEGEDEGSDVATDSQSEGSILTDADEEEEDADASSVAATERSGTAGSSGRVANGNGDAPEAMRGRAQHGTRKGAKRADDAQESQQPTQPSGSKNNFKPAADTEAMMKGLNIDDEAQETVDFESLNNWAGLTSVVASTPAPTNGDPARAVLQRQRQDHQEYRRKRDTDPTFVPNRGSFYMHDTRANADARNDMFHAGPGRGRGRGGPVFGGGFPQGRQMAQPDKTAEQPWSHDLHDTINEDNSQAQKEQANLTQEESNSARLFGTASAQAAPRRLSFSTTVLVGKAPIRVAFPGIKEPIVYSDVPVKRHVRLPEHRAPLRRDKPVRVSLPERPPRYIFPSQERSFIFIPRQNRTSQPNIGRGPFPRHAGSYGYNSRRNSVFGGSVYSASVAPSRRSSLAREVSRESAFSPTGSHYSGFMPPNRPMQVPGGVPYYSATASPAGQLSGHNTPHAMPQIFTYPLPQEAHYQGTPATAVHQPRPQKTISVSGIEQPAVLQQASQDQQPFANQLPPHMSEQSSYAASQSAYYSPRQPLQYPYQQHSTPLSGIPEASAQAPVFSPNMNTGYGQAQSYYPPYQQPPGYYYPPESVPAPNGYGQMPFYPHQPSYPMMTHEQQPPTPRKSPEQTNTPHHGQKNPQSGMVAHESNGMVFYLPAEQAQQQGQGAESYQPAESFVPSYAAYAGQMAPPPVQDMGFYYGAPQPGMDASGMWYPPHQQQQTTGQ
ncbi:hypothetical protein MBLNU230_g4038t1 [Neophaeotheca triangularis]